MLTLLLKAGNEFLQTTIILKTQQNQTFYINSSAVLTEFGQLTLLNINPLISEFLYKIFWLDFCVDVPGDNEIQKISFMQ